MAGTANGGNGGHVDVSGLSHELPDGRPLLHEVSFRVADGSTTALIGPNGTGKTTLLRLIAGDEPVQEGAVARSGGLGVMRQFVGSVRDDTSVAELLVSVAPAPLRAAFAAVETAEAAMVEDGTERSQMRYAQALADFGDAGGYEQEVLWDECTAAALGVSFEAARNRLVRTLSGGEQKRLVLEALLRGPEGVLLLDEPDNYLDVPGKRWLEEQLRATTKSVLLVSHDRELLSAAADRIVTLEPGPLGAVAWTHGGSFAGYGAARQARGERLEELRRRWDEERVKLRTLVVTLREKSKFNDGMASRYSAAQTRLAKFEEAGPPQAPPTVQDVRMRLQGGRTGKRAVVVEGLELTGLMRPFDAELWLGDRVAVLGANGSGKSHFLRLLAAGGSDPDAEHRPVDEHVPDPVVHSGSVRLGARVRPGWFAQTHEQPALVGRTLLDVLHRGNSHRSGLDREAASRALDRYGLAEAAEQRFEHLSGGQQARLQILLLELSGATLLLLDEPTDNLDLHSAEALEQALGTFEGTVVAVTHDRWFARGFDRFLLFGEDGRVVETPEPVWDAGRVDRVR
ncbi:ABC-F family ATP-binding cassette domain-containing protein [Kineococcus radiotolerans]|uniref:ABC transporter related n=1 Tax=Kineococcus radiotolerans (strain ATCC BAA-149 / DSM 14245 / SRS30216) TaxID=266940 RepID=A6W5W9_KINRD|nr:ATP-binding cassette domain-containing protein [Kineococcus radiotolerans]ABS02208.1 ABC transporter related [Kineococcus radiotolerans SRS30216 = ATCC BAA-149]